MLCFSLLFAISLLSITFSEFAWAEESGETLVHADPATFQKNWDLTPAQKEYTITECEKVVSALEKTKPDMSDLEKYFALALWADQRVEYDWDFWYNGYNFDFYRHQWDAYGAMDEDETSVCVGIAIFYSNLCHAADLTCRFVRTNPDFLEHTINYSPDINGNAYYVDVTENVFLHSEYSSDAFDNVDKNFAHITKDCTDTTFDYRESPDSFLQSTDIKECYNLTYDQWFNEYALHKYTGKVFYDKYVEKGSGNGSTHAAYKDYAKQPYASRTGDTTNIWFLDDFYKEPATIKEKIENKELDEQLLIIDAIEENYDCDTEGKSEEQVAEALKDAITADISSIDYFPSFNGSKVVPEAAQLIKDTDYELSVQYDDTEHKATVTITGKGDYKGDCQFTVTVNTAQVTKAPIRNPNLGCNGESQYLLSDKGKAENGEMQFAIGTKDKPTGEFSSEIPTATDARVYYIWYKAAGNEGYYDSEPQRIVQPVTIEPVSVEVLCGEDKTIRVGDTFKVEPKTDPEIEVTFSFVSGDEDVVTVVIEEGVQSLSRAQRDIVLRRVATTDDGNRSFQCVHSFFLFFLFVE